jgi:hypothetical protein
MVPEITIAAVISTVPCACFFIKAPQFIHNNRTSYSSATTESTLNVRGQRRIVTPSVKNDAEHSLRLLKCLLEIGDEILRMFKAH